MKTGKFKFEFEKYYRIVYYKNIKKEIFEKI